MLSFDTMQSCPACTAGHKYTIPLITRSHTLLATKPSYPLIICLTSTPPMLPSVSRAIAVQLPLRCRAPARSCSQAEQTYCAPIQACMPSWWRDKLGPISCPLLSEICRGLTPITCCFKPRMAMGRRRCAISSRRTLLMTKRCARGQQYVDLPARFVCLQWRRSVHLQAV